MANNQTPLVSLVSVGTSALRTLDKIAQIKVTGLNCVALDTNSKALAKSNISKKILLGDSTLGGNGAGGVIENGQMAALESLDNIRASLQGSRKVILLCGLGGGTGSGATPVIAELALDLVPEVKCIATFPFRYEGNIRQSVAKQGEQKLVEILGDDCIIINGDEVAGLFIKDAMPRQEDLSNQLSRASVWKALGCLY